MNEINQKEIMANYLAFYHNLICRIASTLKIKFKIMKKDRDSQYPRLNFNKPKASISPHTTFLTLTSPFYIWVSFFSSFAMINGISIFNPF